MRVIGDIPRLNAKRYPDKKALIMGDECLTYRELEHQANQLAHGLIALGVNPGDRVAILATNCIEFVIVTYGVAKCGALIVPINFRYKKDELVYVINNCEPKALVFGPELAALVAEVREEIPSSLHLVGIGEKHDSNVLNMKDVMEGEATQTPSIEVEPTMPCNIMYTSGTTGFPKGVMFSHSSLLSIYAGMAFEGDLSHDEVTMVPLPLFHNGGLNGLLQPTLMLGGTVVIMKQGFDPDTFLETVDHYGATLTMLVPTQLAMLVNHQGAEKYQPTTLNKIWYGSSAISPTVLRASRDLFKAKFYQWYGQSETGMISVLKPEDHIDRSQCTGREMFNADIRIVDEDGNDTPVGEVGEVISARKPLGMLGYFGMEDRNKKVVRNGWIHTEDLARVEGDGYFTIVDRIRDMIISGAENVYPKEIEDTIMTHPGVLEVAVFGIPDEIYGEAVCAAVVLKNGGKATGQEIIQHCSSKISSYKKPKQVIFMDELPKNATGKVTKNVLKDPYWVGREKRV